MDLLEQIYQKNKDSHNYFPNKKVLFIGSESYDSAVISVIEGLQELCFEIYTIKKPNIKNAVNSWFKLDIRLSKSNSLVMFAVIETLPGQK